MLFDLTKRPDKKNTVKHSKNTYLTKLTKPKCQVNNILYSLEYALPPIPHVAQVYWPVSMESS